MAGTSYDWFDITDGTNEISVHIFNPSGNAQKAKDCKIGQIEVYSDDQVDLKLAKGITPSSTYEEIKAAFGEPSDTYKGDGFSTYTYDFDENNIYEELKFYIREDGSHNSIEMENMLLTEEDITEASTDLPEYLSMYVAPKELGSDMEEPVFKLDGKVYRLPCPLKEFTDDGWTVDSVNKEAVNAGNLEYSAITIKKNDVELNLGMLNFEKVSVVTENCAVASISARRITYDGGATYSLPENIIEIPGGITLKSSKEDAKSAVTSNFSEYISDDKDYYTYTYRNNGKTVGLTYSIGDDYNSSEIEIKNENWDY